jgi:hypothetical protein
LAHNAIAPLSSIAYSWTIKKNARPMKTNHQGEKQMAHIDKNKPVMITGATGYVAGWIVKKLLDEGLTVHAPIRDPESPEKCKHLNRIAADTPGKIKYLKADLLDQGAYAEAICFSP